MIDDADDECIYIQVTAMTVEATYIYNICCHTIDCILGLWL